MPRAGLDAATVTEAGAAVADEVGFHRLSMSIVAERLGVKTPSLYKHVDGLAALAHRIAILAADEVADALRDATQGRAREDALAAASHALRAYVVRHPGRYAATVGARPVDPDDPLIPARLRVLTSLSAVLRGYGLDPADEIHALRMLRSTLDGFATLEAAGSFQIDTDVDESFGWIIASMDRSLSAIADRDPGADR